MRHLTDLIDEAIHDEIRRARRRRPAERQAARRARRLRSELRRAWRRNEGHRLAFVCGAMRVAARNNGVGRVTTTPAQAHVVCGRERGA